MAAWMVLFIFIFFFFLFIFYFTFFMFYLDLCCVPCANKDCYNKQLFNALRSLTDEKRMYCEHCGGSAIVV